MKKLVLALVSSVLFAIPAQAQLSGGILLGGGYLEDPGEGFGFAQIRGTFYEDDSFAHTVFLEILGFEDDATVFFSNGAGTFRADGDITFVNVTVNYELEAKLFGPISAYAGGGLGVEIVSLDSRFNFDIDSDTNFLAQFFAGVRADFGNGFHLQAGVRYLIRDDFSLLGDEFVTEDSFGYEIGAGFQF